MLETTKLLGIGLATTGLIGTGIDIGTEFGALILGGVGYSLYFLYYLSTAFLETAGQILISSGFDFSVFLISYTGVWDFFSTTGEIITSPVPSTTTESLVLILMGLGFLVIGLSVLISDTLSEPGYIAFFSDKNSGQVGVYTNIKNWFFHLVWLRGMRIVNNTSSIIKDQMVLYGVLCCVLLFKSDDPDRVGLVFRSHFIYNLFISFKPYSIVYYPNGTQRVVPLVRDPQYNDLIIVWVYTDKATSMRKFAAAGKNK